MVPAASSIVADSCARNCFKRSDGAAVGRARFLCRVQPCNHPVQPPPTDLHRMRGAASAPTFVRRCSAFCLHLQRSLAIRSVPPLQMIRFLLALAGQRAGLGAPLLSQHNGSLPQANAPLPAPNAIRSARTWAEYGGERVVVVVGGGTQRQCSECGAETGSLGADQALPSVIWP